MTHVKCIYFNCNNTSKDYSLFRFPTDNARRLAIWLNNCGNMTITHLSLQELRNRYLCSAHFDDKFIRNKTGKRKRLTKLAVPQHYKGEQFLDEITHSPSPCTTPAQVFDSLKVLFPTKTYKRQLSMNTEEFEEPNNSGTPKKRKLSGTTNIPKCKSVLINKEVDLTNKKQFIAD